MTSARTGQRLTISAVVIRADGREEDLGVIASTDEDTVTVHTPPEAPMDPDPAVTRYRIALRHPDPDHPNREWFSWRRTYAFNADYHDPGYDPLEAAEGGLISATGEFPDHEARIEKLVDNDDDTSSWVAVS